MHAVARAAGDGKRHCSWIALCAEGCHRFLYWVMASVLREIEIEIVVSVGTRCLDADATKTGD